jgi:hypothetical protein
VRSNPLSQSYDGEKQLAAEVAQYEKHIVEQYHQLDLYRTKGKPKAKISFTDMTLTENLNYVKYNLKTSEEAFDLFKITSTRFSSNPEIAASIV